jgi:hypothetical protein
MNESQPVTDKAIQDCSDLVRLISSSTPGPVRSSLCWRHLVLPACTIHDLGVHVDADISMKKHISMTVRACFVALLRIRTLCRCLPRHALLTLIRALVFSTVD